MTSHDYPCSDHDSLTTITDVMPVMSKVPHSVFYTTMLSRISIPHQGKSHHCHSADEITMLKTTVNKGGPELEPLGSRARALSLLTRCPKSAALHSSSPHEVIRNVIISSCFAPTSVVTFEPWIRCGMHCQNGMHTNAFHSPTSNSMV